MGNFPTNDGYIGRAQAYAPTNTINAPSAWLFENQTGTLGTNLTGSVVYVGTTGNVRAILPGVMGPEGVVAALSLTSGGSGYIAGASATTVVSTVPASNGSGLTLTLTVPVPTTNAIVVGTGYSVAGFTVAQGGGLSGTIDTVNGAGGITGFTITDGGVGYSAGDVLTIVQGGSGDNASITLATAPNGAVTVAAINAGGTGYVVGDIITAAQDGSGLNATFSVTRVSDSLPGVAEAIDFKNVPQGSILPVVVDYLLIAPVTGAETVASNLVIGK